MAEYAAGRWPVWSIACFLRIAAASLAIFLIAGPQSGQTAESVPLNGIALIIGNEDYEHLSPLANPAHDARRIEEMLGRLGFTTELALDRDARRLARDLENFLDDAEGADVALIYYAGHGIEAGGENYLVPVDADLSSLDEAAQALVPIADFMARLREVVPLHIVLLDACRDSPFPPGSAIRRSNDAEPVPIGEGGLSASRGATSLVQVPAGIDNLGELTGFAAAPGRVALDGEPGAGSPYASAFLRHLDTMAGEEFGTVMRMVSEEVYLKTGGTQRPWISENLRRLLYFGAPDATAPEGEARDILLERRTLLLTIAELSPARRGQMEAVANESGVPLDAVFALLRAVGADMPADSAELEEVLLSQAGRVRSLLADGTQHSTADPEIARLLELAETAIREGALEAAGMYAQQAAQRADALRGSLQSATDQLRAQWIEQAAVAARNADIKAISFDYEGAARDYARAHDDVARWDDTLAFRYKLAEAASLADLGDRRSDLPVLERALAAAGQALGIAERLGEAASRASGYDAVATARYLIGDRFGRTPELVAAVAEYRIALDLAGQSADATPIRLSLARALVALAAREGGEARFEEAARVYYDLLATLDRTEAPALWIRAQGGLARLHRNSQLGYRHGIQLDAYRTAVTELTGEPPEPWPLSKSGLALADFHLSETYFGASSSMESVVSDYREVIAALAPDANPVQRTRLQLDLAEALVASSALELINGEGYGEEAGAEALRLAVEAVAGLSVADMPGVLADGRRIGADAMTVLARGREDPSAFTAAVEDYRMAVSTYLATGQPAHAAAAQYGLAIALQEQARLGGGISRLEESAVAYRAALDMLPQDAPPARRAEIRAGLASALYLTGVRQGRAGPDTGMAFIGNTPVFEAYDQIRLAQADYASTFHELLADVSAAIIDGAYKTVLPPAAPSAPARLQETEGRLDVGPYMPATIIITSNGEPTVAPDEVEVTFVNRVRPQDIVPTLHDADFLPAEGDRYGHFDIEFFIDPIGGGVWPPTGGASCRWQPRKQIADCDTGDGEFRLVARRDVSGTLLSLSIGLEAGQSFHFLSGFSWPHDAEVDLRMENPNPHAVRVPIMVDGLETEAAGRIEMEQR